MKKLLGESPLVIVEDSNNNFVELTSTNYHPLTSNKLWIERVSPTRILCANDAYADFATYSKPRNFKCVVKNVEAQIAWLRDRISPYSHVYNSYILGYDTKLTEEPIFTFITRERIRGPKAIKNSLFFPPYNIGVKKRAFIDLFVKFQTDITDEFLRMEIENQIFTNLNDSYLPNDCLNCLASVQLSENGTLDPETALFWSGGSLRDEIFCSFIPPITFGCDISEKFQSKSFSLVQLGSEIYQIAASDRILVTRLENRVNIFSVNFELTESVGVFTQNSTEWGVSISDAKTIPCSQKPRFVLLNQFYHNEILIGNADGSINLYDIQQETCTSLNRPTQTSTSDFNEFLNGEMILHPRAVSLVSSDGCKLYDLRASSCHSVQTIFNLHSSQKYTENPPNIIMGSGIRSVPTLSPYLLTLTSSECVYIVDIRYPHNQPVFREDHQLYSPPTEISLTKVDDNSLEMAFSSFSTCESMIFNFSANQKLLEKSYKFVTSRHCPILSMKPTQWLTPNMLNSTHGQTLITPEILNRIYAPICGVSLNSKSSIINGASNLTFITLTSCGDLFYECLALNQDNEIECTDLQTSHDFVSDILCLKSEMKLDWNPSLKFSAEHKFKSNSLIRMMNESITRMNEAFMKVKSSDANLCLFCFNENQTRDDSFLTENQKNAYCIICGLLPSQSKLIAQRPKNNFKISFNNFKREIFDEERCKMNLKLKFNLSFSNILWNGYDKIVGTKVQRTGMKKLCQRFFEDLSHEWDVMAKKSISKPVPHDVSDFQLNQSEVLINSEVANQPIHDQSSFAWEMNGCSLSQSVMEMAERPHEFQMNQSVTGNSGQSNLLALFASSQEYSSQKSRKSGF